MLGQKQAKSQKSLNYFADKKLKLPERKPHVRSHLSFRGVKRRRNLAGAQTDVCFRLRRLPRKARNDDTAGHPHPIKKIQITNKPNINITWR